MASNARSTTLQEAAFIGAVVLGFITAVFFSCCLTLAKAYAPASAALRASDPDNGVLLGMFASPFGAWLGAMTCAAMDCTQKKLYERAGKIYLFGGALPLILFALLIGDTFLFGEKSTKENSGVLWALLAILGPIFLWSLFLISQVYKSRSKNQV